jgi:hypothetical protein
MISRRGVMTRTTTGASPSGNATGSTKRGTSNAIGSFTSLNSDTPVAASLVDLCGMDVLDRIPVRWVFFDRDFTEL